MKNDQIILHRQGAHLSSYMQLNNKRIDNLVTMIKQQQNDTANLLMNMVFDWQVQITPISQRTQLLFKSTNTIAHLQSKLDNLLAAVETLTTGTLTSYLIPCTTLQTILGHVSQTLRNHGNTLHLIYKHSIHYYTHANFIYWRQHNNLFITLKLPLSAYDMLFNVFQIIQTPNPLHNETSYSTSLQDIDHYLLMAINDQAYTTIPSSVSQNTPPNFKSLLQRKFWHKAHTSCLMAIYYDLPLKVNHLCNFSVIPNKEDQNIIELDQHK